MVPYNRIDEKLLDSATHRALARKMANESMVLLKNTGILPIKVPGPGLKIAVVGPLANQTKVLMGNYSSAPSHAVSVLDGLKNRISHRENKFRRRHAIPQQKRHAGSVRTSHHRRKARRPLQLRHHEPHGDLRRRRRSSATSSRHAASIPQSELPPARHPPKSPAKNPS